MTTHKKSSTIFFSSVFLYVLVFAYRVDSLQIRKAAVSRFIRNNHALDGATYVGVGELQGPEDIAYDKKSGIIYTGCEDGFIKKIYIGKSNTNNVESWVNTGGRPLGVALGCHNELIVADVNKGLLNVSKDGVVKLLTDEAEGLRFNLTDGVDVAYNGMIYFTDASYKYGRADATIDINSGIPHGRFMSFDPITRKTKVLVHDLYFPNGVSVSPDQNYVIFCETPKRRCRKYNIRGSRVGLTENFIENLPGQPDNIRYDDQGHYWIGMNQANATSNDGGILATNLQGKIIAYYTDSNLSLTGGNKIGSDLYCCSFSNPYIIKIDSTHIELPCN
jgi:sugar lactone lactonase YvrE